MRSLGVVVILLLSLVFSCDLEKKPQGILTRVQMADLMIDIYLAEAKVLMLPIVRDSAYKIFLPRQDSLLKKRGIQDSVLRKSYQYYLENPIELESIYDIVIDSLNLREQRLVRTPVVD